MATIASARPGHHSVYVVYLRNPRGDGKAGYYVGMTGLSPEQRFENHKNGIKAGAKDHGAPGLRADYSPTYYAAFLIDPDGNNVEAVCMS